MFGLGLGLHLWMLGQRACDEDVTTTRRAHEPARAPQARLPTRIPGRSGPEVLLSYGGEQASAYTERQRIVWRVIRCYQTWVRKTSEYFLRHKHAPTLLH